MYFDFSCRSFIALHHYQLAAVAKLATHILGVSVDVRPVSRLPQLKFPLFSSVIGHYLEIWYGNLLSKIHLHDHIILSHINHWDTVWLRSEAVH